jgi:hypothetical protein
MALIFTDFSRVIFSNVTGPTLPRRQRVRIEGFTGYDAGDELVLSVNPRIVPSTVGLSERPGINDGEYIRTLGYRTEGDEGDAEFFYRAGVTSGQDGYTKINTVDGFGQYQMIWSGNRIDARRFGVVADGLTSSADANQAGIEAALAAMPPNGGILELPTGRIHHSRPITIPPFCTLRGASGVPIGGTPATQLYMYRAIDAADRNTTPQLRPQAGSVVESLGLGSIQGRLHSLIAYDYDASYTALTGPVLRDLQLGCRNIKDVGEADYAITLNTLVAAPGNIERVYAENVAMSSPRIGFIKVGNMGAQPYNLVLDRPQFSQTRGTEDLGLGGNIPYGYGIINQNNSFSCTINSPAIHAVGVFLWNLSGEFSCSINDADSEYVKRLVMSNGGFANGSQPLLIKRGRFALAGYPGVAAYDENWPTTGVPLVAAANQDFILDQLSRPIIMEGASLDVNGSTSSLRFRVAYGTPIVIRGCTLSNVDPVSRDAAPYSAEKIGGTYIEGSRAWVGAGTMQRIDDRTGCENPSGTVTISGAATSQAVVLPKNEAAASYRVVFAYLSETGAPAAASRGGAYATSIAVGGFTANVGTAPGVGASVTYAYWLELGDT